MRESKLIKQLRFLGTKEFKNLRSFIDCPYFKKSKELVHLYDAISKYYPKFDDPLLEKELLFPIIYPKEVYSDIKLRNLFSRLVKTVEQYLIQLHFEQDTFKKDQLLTEIYGRRNHYEAFEKLIQQQLKRLENLPLRDADYYREKYLLQKQYYFQGHNIQTGKILPYLLDAISNFDEFYIIEKLRLKLDYFNRKSIYSDNAFTKNTRQKEVENPNIIAQLLKKAIQLCQDHTSDLFFETKNLYLKSLEKLGTEDAHHLLIILLNFTLRNIKGEGDLFSREVFLLYKLGIDKNILYPNGQIHETTYLNIVIIAAVQKEYLWLDQFIMRFDDALIGSSKEDIVVFAQAFYHFYRASYTDTISLLSKLKFDQNYMK